MAMVMEREERHMWKKIALIQLALLVALAAFWVGRETRADVEPMTREFMTSNEEGNIAYIWSYDSGSKEWNIISLNYLNGSKREITITARGNLK